MKCPALFEPAEEGGFVVTFPDVYQAVTQGDDENEAVEMAIDALVTMFAHLIREGKTINPPTAQKGRKIRMIELPAMVSAKTELYIAFKSSGLSKTALARKLDMPKTNVDRLFNFKNHTRLDQLEAAFKALGGRMELFVQWAA
jgi:antitoxin HicB